MICSVIRPAYKPLHGAGLISNDITGPFVSNGFTQSRFYISVNNLKNWV